MWKLLFKDNFLGGVISLLIYEAVNKFSMKDPMPAFSLHHVAFQLIAVLRRLSDVLQGRVCHTSPEEIDTTPPASFPATDRSQTYHSCRSYSSASLVSS